MAILVTAGEFLVILLVLCLIAGYGTVRSLLSELCALVLDIVKTARSFSKTSSSLAAKLEADMAKQDMSKQVSQPVPQPQPKRASDIGDGVYIDDNTIM